MGEGGCVHMEVVEWACMRRWRVCAYEKVECACMGRGCVHMEGVECACMGRGCVYMEGVECACMGRGRLYMEGVECMRGER